MTRNFLTVSYSQQNSPYFFIIVVNALALLMAVLLVNKTRISSISRSFIFIPHIISLVAISLIWKFIFGPGFTYLQDLTNLDIFGWSWLGGDVKVTFFATELVAIWQNVGFYMIIYIAGLMAIPSDVIEAASIDGASRVQTFIKVKMPLLMPAFTICLFHSLTYGFKVFDVILVLTQGGPANSTSSIAFNIFREAFTTNRYGLATAKSLIFFMGVLVITLIQLKVFKSKEVEY